MRIRIAGAFVALSTVAALLAGCGPGVAPTEGFVPATPAPTPTQAFEFVAEASAAPTEVEPPSATPTARRGQEATDPTTVSLASGRPALVKFFAFW